MDFETLRREYTAKGEGLRRSALAADPVDQFSAWFKEAREAGLYLPDAMALATVDAEGAPNCRMVVLRGVENGGLLFFTDYSSEKSRELAAEPRATLLFFWNHFERQVRVRGTMTRTSREQSAAYFVKRPRTSQLAALASPQSEIIADRAALEALFESARAKHEGEAVPLPDDWGGFFLKPDSWEFWQGRESRLHDRFVYVASDGGWVIERLAP
jgi:pyridoxamine 5'-phosphate oxidase